MKTRLSALLAAALLWGPAHAGGRRDGPGVLPPAAGVVTVLPSLPVSPLEPASQGPAAPGDSASIEVSAARPADHPALGALGGLPVTLDKAETSCSPTPASSAARIVDPLRRSVWRQLEAMEPVVRPEDSKVLHSIGLTADALLGGVEARLDAGEIEPGISGVRLDLSGAPSLERSGRAMRLGFYPVAGDPLHWAHVLVGLGAMSQLRLDGVVYLSAGDDPRKPELTKASIRHPVIRAALGSFDPFLVFSPLALGTDLDGETNLFRFLAANAARRLHAFYLVGDDHYGLVDKKGRPDTIPKLEANLANSALGHDPDLHKVSVAFIEREGRPRGSVETGLEVDFLPPMPFEASSTDVRKKGALVLMPYDSYRHVKDNRLGLYGIE